MRKFYTKPDAELIDLVSLQKIALIEDPDAPPKASESLGGGQEEGEDWG